MKLNLLFYQAQKLHIDDADVEDVKKFIQIHEDDDVHTHYLCGYCRLRNTEHCNKIARNNILNTACLNFQEFDTSSQQPIL